MEILSPTRELAGLVLHVLPGLLSGGAGGSLWGFSSLILIRSLCTRCESDRTHISVLHLDFRLILSFVFPTLLCISVPLLLSSLLLTPCSSGETPTKLLCFPLEGGGGRHHSGGPSEDELGGWGERQAPFSPAQWA